MLSRGARLFFADTGIEYRASEIHWQAIALRLDTALFRSQFVLSCSSCSTSLVVQSFRHGSTLEVRGVGRARVYTHVVRSRSCFPHVVARAAVRELRPKIVAASLGETIIHAMRCLVRSLLATCHTGCQVIWGASRDAVGGLVRPEGGDAVHRDHPVFLQFPYSSPTVPLQFPYSSPMVISTVPLVFPSRSREVWRVFLSEEENLGNCGN